MTRFDLRWRMSIHSQTRMRARFGEELCTTEFSENVAAAEAPARGTDIFTHASRSRGAEDYGRRLIELRETGFC